MPLISQSVMLSKLSQYPTFTSTIVTNYVRNMRTLTIFY